MGVDLLAAAEALLPARPDLAAAIATQAVDAAGAAGDRDGWLSAAGVVLAARGRFEDGRRPAMDLLAAARRWGSAALTAPAARRLRVELALLAAGAGAAETVRALVAPVLAAGTGGSDRALRPAARIALARSATDPVESTAALRAAREDCADSRAGRIARAEVVLVGAAIARHDGAARTAVEFAEEGLRLLDADNAAADDDLRLSLVAESIAALLDVGEVRRARERAELAAQLLRSTPGPRRQRALLQLTVVSAFAGVREMADTVAALAAAAQEAADSDAPELEAICRSALGAIHEKAGRLDAALAEFQAGVDAQHRDRDREQRFVSAVDAHIALEAPAESIGSVPTASSATVPPPAGSRAPSESEPSAFDPQVDGISWFAGSAWGSGSESRGGQERADSADSGAINPWSGGAWSNGGHRLAAGARPAEAPSGRNSRREVRTSGHSTSASGTNGHDRTAARPARHAKPDPSQLRARDTGDDQERRPAAQEADPLAPGWVGPPERGSGDDGPDERIVDSNDVQTWMRTALEELDRVWGPVAKRDTAPTTGPEGPRSGGSSNGAARTNGNGQSGSAGPDSSGRRATGAEDVDRGRPGGRGATADRSARNSAGRDISGAAREPGPGRPASARPSTDRDAARVEANGLWSARGQQADPDRSDGFTPPDAIRDRVGDDTVARRPEGAGDDDRTRRSALRGAANPLPRRPIDPSSGDEWPLGRSARPGSGERGSDANATGGSRRAPDDSAGADWPLGRAGRAGLGEPGAGRNATSGSRQVRDDGAGEEWGPGRSARPGSGERGSQTNAPGGSRQVRDDGAEWAPGRSGSGERGSETNATGGSRQVPHDSSDEDWPFGRPVRGGAGERGTGTSAVGGSREVRDESPHEDWPLGRAGRAGVGERGAGGDASGGARRVPDGTAGEEWSPGRSEGGERGSGSAATGGSRRSDVADWPHDRPARGGVGERGAGSSGGARRVPDRPAEDERPPGRPEPADRQSRWGADEGWPAAGSRAEAGAEPVAEERPGRRSRVEREPYADEYAEQRASAESDPLFALLRAPKAPVSKDALADLARRLTVAPQRLSIAPDGPDTEGEPNGTALDVSDAGGARSDTGAVGCTVVIDLARDGRRFAGVRAATVIREVAELVAEHVPAGSRVRFDEPDVLALVLPGWEGPDATRWMYRTLPGLLVGFTASEDIRGVQLRATVHDVDGPVGAQLLHRIDGGRNAGRGRHGSAADEPSVRRAEPEPERTARTARVSADRPPPRPVERAAHRAVRDDAAAPAQDRVKPDTPAPAPTPAPFTPADADGLGLADLLAGALAAYRSI